MAMEPLAGLFDRILGPDDQARVEAYLEVLARTDSPADIYPQWTRFEGMLVHPNNHIRSIGGQLYSHFASSDPEGRVWALWEQWKRVAADKMFVTARHTIQASPRFARAGAEHRSRLIAYYQERFRSCAAEKNTTLIRYDIQVCLREVYDQKPDPALAALARALILEEPDPKYQTKYRTAWKKVPG
jgi:hypothetical protein